MQSAALFRKVGDRWRVEAAAGAPLAQPDGASVVKSLGGQLVLALDGRKLGADDQRVLSALAGQLSTAVETHRLQDEAARAGVLAEANDLRAALLQAVSHDLRSPLAAIKASISSLRQHDIAWAPEDIDEFQSTIEQAADRLDALIAHLLDMSRLQAGALSVAARAVFVDEIVSAAVINLGNRASSVSVDVSETLPAVHADPALLERAIANLVDNALTASPPEQPVRIEAGAIPGGVDIRIVDRGKGIPLADREHVFEPFQRLVDHGTGVGLGLAIARGFVDAMGGTLVIEDTPGGGVTMVITLPQE
jgi:two-component system sensor histidine kinase KdpD